MSITFLPLAVTSDTASGVHSRRLSSHGFTETAAGAFGTHRRRLRSLGTSYGGAIDNTPEIPALGIHRLYRRNEGATFSGAFAEGEHRRGLRSFGYAGAAGAAGGVHTRQLRSWGRPEDVTAGYGLLVARPFSVSAYGGQWFMAAHDGLLAAGGSLSLPVSVTRDRPRLSEFRQGLVEAHLALADAIAMSDQAFLVMHDLVTDLAAFDATGGYSYTAVARAVERVLTEGAASSYSEALSMVLDAMVLRALADVYAIEQVTDAAVLAGQVADLYTALGAALDRIVTSDEATGGQHMTALVREAVVLDQAAATSAEFAAVVRDAVGLAMHLTVDSGDYVAWTLNTEGRGTTTYQNFPFNSFAQMGGKYYGATSQGLYLLEGQDDDGTPVDARIRLGMHDMNTRKLKRLPEAYIGYKSDGNLILRTIVTDDRTGEKVALQYLMKQRPAAALRESRFEPGRGVKAVDWDFEIENVDGADFDLAEVEFHPLIMDRRTRG